MSLLLFLGHFEVVRTKLSLIIGYYFDFFNHYFFITTGMCRVSGGQFKTLPDREKLVQR